MEKNRSIKDFSYLGIARLSSVALQAVFYLLFAALLEPESYGQFNYIVALAGTFSIISGFGLSTTLIVNQAKKILNYLNK